MIRVNSIQMNSRLLPLSFTCQHGEVLHVIGPNGSGKSTLLAAISGVIEAKGEVFIDEKALHEMDLESLAMYRAYLSQSARPAFNIDVYQYLSLSVPACSKSESETLVSVVNELASLVQIEDKLHRSIHQLSGGEWQRVRLAAICLQVWPALNPYAKVLLLDEPAAPLDIGQEVMLYRLIRRISELGITVIMANHDLNRALRHADRVLLLDKGVLQAFGSAEEVLTEEQLSATFNTNVKKVHVEGKPLLFFDDE
ncbi:vitamin B12 ABC transporter ATP-binding protein BtuD [Vibrio mexicanus]|uniref:vitamin B12 ABC transporter ATP-binding protein BtuD n=1 Tax=Vibrio mexicanus TaxID=1004326 RepID=UPI00063CB7E4|nr:vitamin B12 ABC transporter ATP-binding protein BtuD [Vibrio mexicanus]